MKKLKINLSEKMVDDLKIIAQLELISVHEVIADAIKEHFEEHSNLYYAKGILGFRYIPDEDDEGYEDYIASLPTDEEPPFTELDALYDDYFDGEVVRRMTIELPDELYEKIIYFEKEFDANRFAIVREALEDYTYLSTTLAYYNDEYCDEEMGFFD